MLSSIFFFLFFLYAVMWCFRRPALGWRDGSVPKSSGWRGIVKPAVLRGREQGACTAGASSCSTDICIRDFSVVVSEDSMTQAKRRKFTGLLILEELRPQHGCKHRHGSRSRPLAHISNCES